MQHQLLRSVAAISLLATTVGCTQVNPTGEIGAFADATEGYGREASTAYYAVNRFTLEGRIAELAAIDDPDLVGREIVDEEPFDPFLADEELAPRLQLLEELRGYAAALGDLSRANYKEQIDAAAKELGGTFQSLSETTSNVTGAPLSGAETGAITSVVAAFGNAIVDEQRAQAIKGVVTTYNPVVQDATNVLATSDWDSLLSLQQFNLNSIYAEEVAAYKAEFDGLTHAERRERLRRIAETFAAADGVDDFFDELTEASMGVGRAHQTLTDVVSENRFSSRELAQQIGELGASVAQMAAFRQRFSIEG